MATLSRLATRAGLLCVLILVGCASSRSPNTAKAGAGAEIYRAIVGRAPEPRLLVDVLLEVLPRYGYYPERPNLNQLATEWRLYAPDPAEAQHGIRQLRDRLVIAIRPRGRAMYLADLRLEYQVQNAQGEWVSVPPPAQLVEALKAFEREVKGLLERYMSQY
ncbi:MAG: hypothetical protein N2561_04840 [Bacteroidetes bacterium]|nr:hypothetical protein [Rhodothermia bacterium]MCS7154473.1 hypothetical protein [Bacteroidota bacterium]MCX7906846.1 hypothetical protein [Bacteroidota bacterium]MDW8136875.1 hypothetical protein [Bacteroidota bacterium]MDW8285255.1 hypothetical protein [Bacteroidota bacterium]